MARMPDGWVIIAEADERGVEVRLKESRELVMCKNCKYAQTDVMYHDIWCDGIIRNPDWFCADGERRDE